ncbi:hypothetical protein R3P38DRAFT_481827 [Favolaschia claudopus]|uniref:Uncharacterized protein n=1 Tax=Favolaschia claudopus TaxID=2862362 RepID=A0AAW0CIH8_9AGAR
MASLDLHHSTYSDSQLESDIADEDHELNCDEDSFPPRPTSRLGFNSVATSDDVPPAAQTRSRPALKWTRNLFQKIGFSPLSSDVDMDITAAPIISPTADDDDMDPLTLPILPSCSSAASTSSLSLMDIDGSSCDEYDSDSDSYSSGDSDVELDSASESENPIVKIPLYAPPLPLPPLPPAVTPAPVASYAPPPASASPQRLFSRQPTAPYAPSLRTRFSCLPSPLSPIAASRTSYATPLRHAYGHHGRSRHALLHMKYLWNVRSDQWLAHDAAQTRERALLSPNHPLDADRHRSLRSSPSPPPVRSPEPQTRPLPPLTVHPRRGDLSALRDPGPAHMDRCFVGMPLWTMSKTLWMYDVHVLAGHRERERVAGLRLAFDYGCQSEEESGSEGENSMMASSVSTAGFSDDSDETLVDSERSDDEGVMEDVDLSSDDGKPKDSHNSPLDRYLTASKPRTRMPTKLKLQTAPVWETAWYKRFEVLFELLRMDNERAQQAQQQLQQQLMQSQGVSSPPRSRFFIGDENEDADDCEGDEPWSEERWDNVLSMGHGAEDPRIISNHILVH